MNARIELLVVAAVHLIRSDLELFFESRAKYVAVKNINGIRNVAVVKLCGYFIKSASISAKRSSVLDRQELDHFVHILHYDNNLKLKLISRG